MNKKTLIIIIISALAFTSLIGGGLYYAFSNNTKPVEEEKTNKKRIVEPENIIPVAERPYMRIIPKADGHNIEIVVASVNKDATEAEYLLEYQSGTLVQGQEDTIALNTLPASKQVFLGTCSAGGKCSFHEDVPGGSIRTRFSGGEPYVVKSDWKFIDNKAKETAFSSKDAKFQITSDALKTERFLVIYNSPGFPKGLEGTPVSDPYSLEAPAALKGTADLTIRATTEGNLVIMGWDGSNWKEFKGTVDGKTVTAKVDLLQFYIAVTK